jgi:hypothetical protein
MASTHVLVLNIFTDMRTIACTEARAAAARDSPSEMVSSSSASKFSREQPQVTMANC